MNKRKSNFQLMLSIKKWFEEDLNVKYKNFFTVQLLDCDVYSVYSVYSQAVIIKGIVTNQLINDFDSFHVLYSFFQYLLIDCKQEKLIWNFNGMINIIEKIVIKTI